MSCKHALAAAALAVTASPAMAQATDSESTEGSTSIVQVINLTKNDELRFGTIVRPQMGSSVVTINQTTGNRTLDNGNAVLVGSGTGRAEFSVLGFGGQTFSIATPAILTMTRQSGSETIPVNLVRSADSDTLDSNTGAATFGVGGNFTLSNSTAYGFYSGTFDVTVQYQ